MTLTRSPFLAVALATCVSACSGGDNSSKSPTSPSGPGGTAPTAGAWIGTITRPGGLDPLTVTRWDVTANNDGSLTGSLTLTSGGASVTLQARGGTGGNDQNGYTIHMSFSSNAGDFPAFPSCSVRGNSIPQTGDPFPSPYTAITVPGFDISYSGCRGFIDTGYSSPQANFLQETVQLSLRK